MSGEALARALAAEHAAIFGYGLVGARMEEAAKESVRQTEAAHRDRRDAVITRMANENATPAPAAPAYDMPFAVTDRATALRLAIALEEGTAQAWRLALAETTGDDRKFALDALTDSALRASRWRTAAGVTPATVPFPGE